MIIKSSYFLNRSILLTLLFVTFLSGCIVRDKLYPLPADNIIVKGDKIYHNNKIFAEIRYFLDGSDNKYYRGIAIYYHQYNKEIWIYPKQGWHLEHYGNGTQFDNIADIDRVWRHEKEHARLLLGNKPPTKGEFISIWCSKVSISRDGKYVYYEIPGVIFNSSYKYSVEHGVSTKNRNVE